MQITTDVSKISKTVQPNLTFILNILSELSIHFSQISIVIAKKNVGLFTYRFFIENDAALLCVTVRERAREFAATI